MGCKNLLKKAFETAFIAYKKSQTQCFWVGTLTLIIGGVLWGLAGFQWNPVTWVILGIGGGNLAIWVAVRIIQRAKEKKGNGL